jgi:hypothetical protein
VWHEHTQSHCFPTTEATREPLRLLAESLPYRCPARHPPSRTTNPSFAEQCHRDAETAHPPGRLHMILNLLVLLDFGSKHQQYSSETNVIGRGFSLAVNAGSNPCRGAKILSANSLVLVGFISIIGMPGSRSSSPESKRGYGHSIDEFVEWYCSEPRLS